MFEDNSQQQNKDFKKIATKYLIPGLVIIALVLMVFSGSLYIAKYHPNVLGLSKATDNSPTVSPEETEELIKKVSELILLPTNESPNVATVNDLSQVRSQDFFKNAEVGDKILSYSTARKAYLYRPSEHKLIEVGIVNESSPDQTEGGENIAPQVVTPTPFPTLAPVDDLIDDEDSIQIDAESESSPTPSLIP